jgi:hypothetical protein
LLDSLRGYRTEIQNAVQAIAANPPQDLCTPTAIQAAFPGVYNLYPVPDAQAVSWCVNFLTGYSSQIGQLAGNETASPIVITSSAITVAVNATLTDVFARTPIGSPGEIEFDRDLAASYAPQQLEIALVHEFVHQVGSVTWNSSSGSFQNVSGGITDALSIGDYGGLFPDLIGEAVFAVIVQMRQNTMSQSVPVTASVITDLTNAYQAVWGQAPSSTTMTALTAEYQSGQSLAVIQQEQQLIALGQIEGLAPNYLGQALTAAEVTADQSALASGAQNYPSLLAQLQQSFGTTLQGWCQSYLLITCTSADIAVWTNQVANGSYSFSGMRIAFIQWEIGTWCTNYLNRSCTVSEVNNWSPALIQGTATTSAVRDSFLTSVFMDFYGSEFAAVPSNSQLSSWVTAVDNGDSVTSVEQSIEAQGP